MSLALSEIVAIVSDRIADKTLLKEILQDLNKAEEEIKASKDPATTKGKYRQVILIRGDASLKALVAGGAFLVAVPETPEGDVPADSYMGEALLQRITKAARTANEQPKGKRGKSRKAIATFVDAMRWLKPKTIKQSESQFKIKESGNPVEIIVVEKETLDL